MHYIYLVDACRDSWLWWSNKQRRQFQIYCRLHWYTIWILFTRRTESKAFAVDISRHESSYLFVFHLSYWTWVCCNLNSKYSLHLPSDLLYVRLIESVTQCLIYIKLTYISFVERMWLLLFYWSQLVVRFGWLWGGLTCFGSCTTTFLRTN